MNVLAHIYLSGDSDQIIIGNYIGDYVKGRDYLKYPDLVRKGIILHRHIDAFTDRHPVVHRSKIFFSKKYHKYSGVVTDIIYDHFLQRSGTFFHNAPLRVSLTTFTELLLTIMTFFLIR